MTVAAAPGAINAALSVTTDEPSGDYRVELAVHGPDVPGLARQAAITLRHTELGSLSPADVPFSRCLARDAAHHDRFAAGDSLFRAVFRERVAALWETIQPLVSAGHPLRVRLNIQPDRLAPLPWELLVAGGQEWIFLRQGVSMWRGPQPQPPAVPADLGPMRVLVVVCNPHDRHILVDKELTEITCALADRVGRHHVEILDGPSRDQLSREIDQLRPHVLHFIGHGMPRPGRAAELAFNWVAPGRAEVGHVPQPWELGHTDVGQLADWRPPLVVINACRTAGIPAEPGDSLDPVGGLAGAFLSAGAGAVVSMQADIESPAAVDLSAVLYKGVSELVPLDEIIAGVRRQSYRGAGDTGEWALPVLTARTDPAHVLNVSFAAPDPLISGLCGRREYARLRNFVDEYAERRHGWWALDPPLPNRPARPLLIIRGQPVDNLRSGKTWLTHWCLLTWFLRGLQVSYVDLGATQRFIPHGQTRERAVITKDWLDVIRVIRDACTSSRQPQPLPVHAFDDFNTTLNALVSGRRPGPSATPVAGPVADELAAFNDSNRGHRETRIQEAYAAFLAALQTAPGARPHVIALDHADSILAEDFDRYVYPEFIRAVAEDPQSAIRLVLVGSDDWLRVHLPDADRDLWTPLRLEGFQPGQFMRLARAYCRRRGVKNFDDPAVVAFFDALQNLYVSYSGVPVSVFDSLPEVVLRTGES